eukprot:15332323-Ditylum_brightwellii.AAC.2
MDLPVGKYKRIPLSDDHTTDLKQGKSIGGQVATFLEIAIAYLAKWQITVATSFTKVEFVQAVSAAKMAK